MRKWWYRRQFRKVEKLLKDLYQRHRDAGHEVYLNIVDSGDVHLSCHNCPELQPLKRKGTDVVHIYRAHDGTPYTG